MLLGGAAAVALMTAGAAIAQDTHRFDIPQQEGAQALNQFAAQAGVQIVFPYASVRGRQAPAVKGDYTRDEALRQLTTALGLEVTTDAGGVISLRDPLAQGAGGSAGADVEALIVTAQKREENIQDVPIAISAFSQKALDEQKIEGGFDLLKAIPNVTFSKNNFSGYNFSIRGIGTKAISVTTDPAVAVAFNSTPLIRNRLFEQEYFDIERVEVLRGPQGTLYGRNATAGVINVISAKPVMGEFDGSVKAEVGNYNARRMSGFVNVPLGDALAIRLAGAGTQRDGYDYNLSTGNPVNGRDLWSTRLTVGFEPTERFRANLIWERFEEDDDRSRTGKQLCHRDNGPTEVEGVPVDSLLETAFLSQGCKPGSLYDPAAFGTPNGASLPFVYINLSSEDSGFTVLCGIGSYREGERPPYSHSGSACPLRLADPYGGRTQSSDIRAIESIRDPKYRAKTDVFELNWDFDLTENLTLTSQTAYVTDEIYSFQDYNRFNTDPIFNDASNLLWNRVPCDTPGAIPAEGDFCRERSPYADTLKNGIFCDPQIGCSDRLAGFDISRARSKQLSQEFRIQSAFDGPVNFGAGINYTRYKTEEDYIVMFNLITMTALNVYQFNASGDITKCTANGFQTTVPVGTVVDIGAPGSEGCVYIDPNPVESINGDGHNYFRSKNPYKLSSAAAFGELYWELAPEFKLTAGLRYTDDRKTFTSVPSQTLLSNLPGTGGFVDRGYPSTGEIKQHWGEVTGRLGVDWKPDLSFTDETMIYAFYSRGYKGGGANPPGIGFSTEPRCALIPEIVIEGAPCYAALLSYPALFDPEFVNAFELGSKNILLGGALVLNTAAFYYDYKDYQVSQIKERTAVNENFDAKVWGLELEALFQPSRNLRLNANIGYQDTRIADGEKSIDLMNRTQGDDSYILAKPFVTMASNCIVPIENVAYLLNNGSYFAAYGPSLCSGGFWGDMDVFGGVGMPNTDRSTWPNLGAGIYADLSENELPNAPHWTISTGAQYSRDFGEGWRATVRSDAYWQSQSWARVYNAVNDKLHGWYNVNLSLWIERPDEGLKIEIYAKNLLDKTPITDAFLNSDDSALTTNVFVLDPRLIGFSIRKEF